MSLIDGVFLVLYLVLLALALGPGGRAFWTPEGAWLLVGFFVLTAIGSFAVCILLIIAELQRPDWQHKNNPGFGFAIYAFIGTVFSLVGLVGSIKLRRRLIAFEKTKKRDLQSPS